MTLKHVETASRAVDDSDQAVVSFLVGQCWNRTAQSTELCLKSRVAQCTVCGMEKGVVLTARFNI